MNTGLAPSHESEAASQPWPAAWRTAVLLSVVVVLTFAVYAGALNFQFVYDDTVQIVYNPAVQSWQNLPRLFAEQVWSGQSGVAPNYYRPVFMAWCLLCFKIFGLKPAWWHLGVIVVHLVATALVFLLARNLTADDITAFVAALLFGLHPIHVESVAWISGVTDPLMAVFCLGSFLCYLRFRQDVARRGWWLAASLVQFGLACMSKEPGIVLVAIVACHAWLAAHGKSTFARLRQVLVHAAPFAFVATLYLLQRSRALSGLAHPVAPLPLAKIPLSWPKVWWFYLSKLVLPIRLSLFYDTHYVLSPTWSDFWQALLLVFVVAAAVYVVIRRLPSGGQPSPRSIAWLSVAWIVFPLFPAMNILSLEPGEIVHDRYLYLPSVGFAILLAMAIRRLRVGSRKILGLPAVQFACVVLLAGACAASTVRQSLYWANDFLLYYRGVAVSPNSLNALNALANALIERDDYDEGIRMHERILRANPDFWQSQFALGNALFKVGRFQESEQHLAQAARLHPDAPQIAMYLAIAQMKNQHFDDAERSVRRAIDASPNTLGGHYVLGLVLEQRGRWKEAAAAFRQELALDANQPKVQEELARAERQGK